MCGELEDEKGFDDEVMSRLLYIVRGHGITPETLTRRATPPLVDDSGRSAYMSELFRRVLIAAVSDLVAVPEGQRADTVANQAVVFARLAGFLAGQLPPDDETLRATMEALLHGHAEPAKMFAHQRAHDHGHDHDHDHEHGHDHGHHHH
jgi:hypothetical protein